MEERLVSVAKAAAVAGRARATLYAWIASGRLTRYVEDGHVKVSLHELAEMDTPMRGRRPKDKVPS